MPKEGTEQRKLAAVMFTDMAGYPDASGRQRNEALHSDARFLPIMLSLQDYLRVKT